MKIEGVVGILCLERQGLRQGSRKSSRQGSIKHSRQGSLKDLR